MLFIDIPLYNCEYLAGGLSDNTIINRRKSPTYAMTLYKELAEDNRLPLRQKSRSYINYWRFSFFNNKSFFDNLKNVNYNPIAFICYPLGFILKIKDDRNDVLNIGNK